MTVSIPDFSNLSAVQFAVILGAVAAFDWVTGIVGAVAAHAFDYAKVLDFLETHGLKRVATIGVVYLVGEVADLPGLRLAADGLLALYVGETVLSSAANLTQLTPPAP